MNPSPAPMSQPRRTFLQQASLIVGGLATARLTGRAAAAAQPAGTNPAQSSPAPAAEPAIGVPAGRLARLATGANLCRWFCFPPAVTTEHFANYIGDAEAALIAGMGLKHVRLCVAPKYIMDAATGAVIEECARQLEGALRRLQRAGLAVIVDLHNEERVAELDPAWQAAFARFWGDLARRLAAFDPELTFLEIINEPVFDRREGEWNTLNARLAEAIRGAAPRHTIVTSGPNWGGIDGLKKLALLPDRNVVYSFHCYDPFPFTHQGATWSSDDVKPLRQVPYPSSPEGVAPLLPALEGQPASRGMLEYYGRERWDRARLAARFREGVAWGERHGVPLYCGEFGVFPKHALPVHRANWFRDFGVVLASHRIGWAVWGWDNDFGLNRRYEGGKPVVDRVVAEALGLKVV